MHISRRPGNLSAILLISGGLLSGCKVNQQVQTYQHGLQIPATYQDAAADTANSALINRSDYFTDPELISLIDTALVNNSDLKVAWQRIEEARADVLATRGQLIPGVSISGSAGTSGLGLYTADWAGNNGAKYATGQSVARSIPDYNLGFLSSWEIDVWGKLRNKKKAAISRYLAGVEGKNYVVTNLVADIATNYFDLLALDNDLKIIRESMKIQQDALSVVQSQKAAAAANELAVKQFEAQVLNSQSLEKGVIQQIAETENAINLLLGRFPQPVKRKSSLFTDSISFNIHSGVPSELLQNRPDIRQAELELLASNADIKAARAAFYPSFTISGELGFNAFNPSYLFLPQSIAYNLLAGLAAPLINRSAIKADFHRAGALQLESLYAYQKAILNGYVEVANQVAGLKNLGQIYDLKSREVQVLTESINTSFDLFKTGRATYLEVLLTEQNALQSQLDLAETRKQQYHTFVNMYKALGGGWRK